MLEKVKVQELNQPMAYCVFTKDFNRLFVR